MIFFGPKALLKISPFKTAIISSFFTFFFIIYNSKYIKPNILLKSASIGSKKNYFIKIIAFFLLLWCRVSSLSLLIKGNYGKAFGFPSIIYAYFIILYTP